MKRNPARTSYILGLAVASIGLTAELGRSASRLDPEHRAVFVVLSACLLAAELLPAKWLSYKGRPVTLSSAFTLALVLLGGHLEAVLVVAGVTLVSELVHIRRLWSAVANPSQLVLCTWAAIATIDAFGHADTIRSGAPLGLTWLLGVTAAGAALYCTNAVLVSIGARLAGHGRVAQLVISSLKANLLGDAMMLPLGPPLVVLGLRGIALLPFIGITLLMLSWASRLTASREHLAMHDALTGLGNRRLLHDRLAELFSEPSRSDERLAIIFVDLDKFKPVNDRYGHGAGDDVLRQTARRLTDAAPAMSLICRLGGDEFALLVPSPTPSAARDTACRLRIALREPIGLGTDSITIDASFGVAIIDDSHATSDELLAAADRAMYRAKFERRGVVVVGENPSPASSVIQLCS